MIELLSRRPFFLPLVVLASIGFGESLASQDVPGNSAFAPPSIEEGAMAVPETGPIGLAGDRGQMECRRIRIGPPAE